MPTSMAISTRELTESKTPVRLPLIPLIRSSLSHSAIASKNTAQIKCLVLSSGGAGRRGAAPPWLQQALSCLRVRR